jgi:OOP family OmpA-OmpF porin
MKQILTLLIILAAFQFSTYAQDSTQIKKPTIGLHFFYNDFQTAQLIGSTSLSNVLKNKLWNKPQNMEGGY